MRIQRVGEYVKDILENDIKARNCDNYLYFKVCEKIGQEKNINLNVSIADFFLKIASKDFPSFESVSRSRRKCQEKYPYLVADEIVEGYRKELENEFREYARNA